MWHSSIKKLLKSTDSKGSRMSVDETLFNNIAPFICDSHVHVGYFKENTYYSPKEIYNNLKNLGIKKWAVSSISSVNNNHELVENELVTLFQNAPDETVPILWLTPEMLKNFHNLNIRQKIPFYGIKIHGFANNWEPSGSNLNHAFEIANELKLPLILHTGGKPESDAMAYNQICGKFKEVKIILAHGRPIDQAIEVVRRNPNVYVDTAFMPLEHIQSLKAKFNDDKILFGTDFPIDTYFFPDESATKRYKERVISLVKTFGENAVFQWANANFHKIFSFTTVRLRF